MTEVEKQNAELETARKRAAIDIKSLTDKFTKQEQTVRCSPITHSQRLTISISQAKQLESSKTLMESQTKVEKSRLAKLEKELDAEQKERKRWESKVTDLDSDLTVRMPHTRLVMPNSKFHFNRRPFAKSPRMRRPHSRKRSPH